MLIRSKISSFESIEKKMSSFAMEFGPHQTYGLTMRARYPLSHAENDISLTVLLRDSRNETPGIVLLIQHGK